MNEEVEDDTLLSRSADDPQAFRLLYRRHAAPLLAYLRRGSGNAEVAVELLAETMALAYEHRDRYDSARGSVGAWMFGIARRELQSYWRHERVLRGAVGRLAVLVPRADEDSTARIDAMVDAQEQGPALAEALATLSPAERDAVLMRVVDEQPYDDVAAELQCTPNAARVRVHRGLSHLKAVMEGNR